MEGQYKVIEEDCFFPSLKNSSVNRLSSNMEDKKYRNHHSHLTLKEKQVMLDNVVRSDRVLNLRE